MVNKRRGERLSCELISQFMVAEMHATDLFPQLNNRSEL